jgi:hypothetical protein
MIEETMSDPESPNEHQVDPTPDGGVLAALPRTRPQRASPRRAAARTGTPAGAKKPAGARAAKESAVTKKPTATKKPAATKRPTTTKRPVTTGKPAASRKRASKPVAKPPEPPGGRAPSQGYEPEEEVELGATVNPPSGAELVESVANIVGELANSGLAAGGRLLKDAFSLLRRP